MALAAKDPAAVIYAVDCGALTDAERFLPFVEKRRQSFLKRCQDQAQYVQSLAAGLLLAWVSGRGVVRSAPVLCYGPEGKPEFAEDNGLHFSLSHTDGWAFCAVSAQNIGFDAQAVGWYDERVAEHFFFAEELLNHGNRAEQFFRLWTMKESYVKYTGNASMFSKISVFPEQNVPVFDREKDCWFLSQMFQNHLQTALCMPENPGEVPFISLKFRADGSFPDFQSLQI